MNHVGIAQRQNREFAFGWDFENRHVDLAIGGDDSRRQALQIGEPDFNFFGLVDDMLGRENVTLWVDNEPGAATPLGLILSRFGFVTDHPDLHDRWPRIAGQLDKRPIEPVQLRVTGRGRCIPPIDHGRLVW